MELTLTLLIPAHLALLIVNSVIQHKHVIDVNSVSIAQVKYVHQYVQPELIQMPPDNVQTVLIIVLAAEIHQFAVFANLAM